MSALTPYGRRRTRIMGSRGFLEGDGHQVTVTDFVTGQSEAVAVGAPGTNDPRPAWAEAGGGHGGGDYGVISSFVEAVATGDRSFIRSGPRESLDSHLMAFAAEHSRQTGSPVRVADLVG
jgi:predicted dehydrogenase